MPARLKRKQVNKQLEVGFCGALRAICNRNFNGVTIINLLVMTAYYLIFVTSAGYARQTYGASLSTAGFTAGITVLGCLGGRFLTGNLLSIFGCRNVLFTGLALYAGSMAGFFLVDSLPLLLAQRLLAGIGIGIISTATGTIMAYVVPQRLHGFGVSLFTMSTALALALGPFLGISAIDYFGYPFLMRVNLGISLLSLAAFFTLRDLPPTRHLHRSMFDLNSYIDPRVVRFSLVALLTCLSYGCIQAFMTSFAEQRNLVGPSSLFFLCYAVTTLGTRALTGRLFDQRGENVIFYPALLLTSASLLLLSYARTPWMLLCSGLLLGASFGNFQSIGQAVALSLVTRSRFAQATTTFYMFFDLGIGIGPYLFGFIIPSLGFAGMYQTLAVVVLGALGLYYFVHGKNTA